MTNPLTDINPELLIHFERWSRARVVVEGSRAVKRGGVSYLPKSFTDQTTAEYEAHKARVVFLPMAATILESYLGLMFRKEPVLECDDAVRAALDAITPDGMNYMEFSEHVAREHYMTNWQLLLVDQPPARAGLSRANAFQEGARPFIAPYTAENIMNVEFGVIANSRRITYLKLRDSDVRIRHLRINDAGVYEVQLEEKIGEDSWTLRPPVVPRVNGAALREIPVVLITNTRCTRPKKAPLDDVVELNLNHYAQSGLIDAAMLHTSAPVTVITGATDPTSEDAAEGDAGVAGPNSYNGQGTGSAGSTGASRAGLSVEPGSIWYIGAPDAKVYYHEYQGAGMEHLLGRLTDLEDKVSELSGGFWTREKAAVESAETHRIRRAVQNARVASTANLLASKLRDAFQLVSDWMGGGQVEYSLNTDYLPTQMTAQEMTAHITAWEKGAMSGESLFYAFRDGEVFDAALTYEEELERRKADEAKREEEAQKAIALAAVQADQLNTSEPDEEPAL